MCLQPHLKLPKSPLSTFLVHACMLLTLMCFSGSFAVSAAAQRNPVYISLEADVARASEVYVGTVSHLESLENVKESNRGSTVTVDVTQTLKGKPRKRFKVFINDEKVAETFRAWNQKRIQSLWFHREETSSYQLDSPMLWFIRMERGGFDTEAPGQRWTYRPLDPTETPSPLPMVGYFSMEFRLIRSPRQVLDIVRRYAKADSQNEQLHSLRYMPSLVQKQFPYATGGELLVPIGPQLEKVARRMILSPGSLLPSEREIKGIKHSEYVANKAIDEGSVRRMGVEALARFKSDENITLLKRQLEDPFLESYWDNDLDVYSVRKMAFKALKAWGVQVAEPQLHPSSNGTGQAKQIKASSIP